MIWTILGTGLGAVVIGTLTSLLVLAIMCAKRRDRSDSWDEHTTITFGAIVGTVSGLIVYAIQNLH